MKRPMICALASLGLAAPALAVCNDGPTGAAYTAGFEVSYDGLAEPSIVAWPNSERFCYIVGLREGRLQRLLLVSQPHPPQIPPMIQVLRPRTAQAG